MLRKAFLDLPAEVRVAIYEYTFANHTVRIHSETCAQSGDSEGEALLNGEQALHDHSGNQHLDGAAAEQIENGGHEYNPGLDVVPQLQQNLSSRASLKNVLHVSLFLLSKTIKEEATPIFWNLTNFELHAQCINQVPSVLSEFTRRDPDWKLENLNAPDGTKPSARSSFIHLLRTTRTHVTSLSIPYIRQRESVTRSRCYTSRYRYTVDARITIRDARFVDIRCVDDHAIVFLERAIRKAYGFAKEECCGQGGANEKGMDSGLVWMHRCTLGRMKWFTQRYCSAAWAPNGDVYSEIGIYGDTDDDSGDEVQGDETDTQQQRWEEAADGYLSFE